LGNVVLMHISSLFLRAERGFRRSLAHAGAAQHSRLVEEGLESVPNDLVGYSASNAWTTPYGASRDG